MNFSRQLLCWYLKSKRDLPWRQTKDPYLIWISEIIMQQTRIDQGLPYYQKFVLAWPTVARLAEADEQEVLKLWQGLGYYSRARNLHATARMIVELYGGTFPDTYLSIRNLKGVGDYTAAAIASIAFNLPYPVVDGNVLRFMTRLYGIVESVDLPSTKRKILDIAVDNIDHRYPGDFNQAMMEFGARVCTPANPDCVHCIFRTNCLAFALRQVESIPARATKPPLRHRYFHYLVATFEHENRVYIFLNKRTGKDIWKNLYDFPQAEKTSGAEKGWPAYEREFGKALHTDQTEYLGVSEPSTCLLTHQKLQMMFYRFHSTEKIDLPFLAVPLNELWHYPFPRPVEKYLSEKFPLFPGAHCKNPNRAL